MRLFVALDIDDAIRQRLARFLEGVRGFAPDLNWARSENLHVTLKFIGEQRPERLEAIQASLRSIKNGVAEFQIAFRGYGFFPTPKSARVFWAGIEAGPQLASLAKSVDVSLAQLGVPAETRPFSPHLTLARSGSGRPQRGPGDRSNNKFQRVQEKLSAMPPLDFGTMTAHDFFLYESKLSPKGAQYTKLERFPFS
jgi:2'-5' RNA ligase